MAIGESLTRDITPKNAAVFRMELPRRVSGGCLFRGFSFVVSVDRCEEWL
jgi:hypothetical protein